ncbi:MAG: gliding motility-associated C-terminal domain-containing protein [Haliscomenobacter sp.]|nr:gliding motility-associated C-terminal domain-containing protein [Haliscomenobacter sp.]MBK9488366.1 gliding motility-associated C-terminal domain-containing protein [Haliscomenobacter sp.]
MNRCILLAIYVLAVPIALSAQRILNGSFEGSGQNCGINLSNQVFTAAMPNVVGFGEKNELDILSAPCNYGNAVRGTHFIAMTVIAGLTDAIGLKLSEPLMPGQTYTLQFYEKIGRVINGPARLSVGIASNPTSHGELLFTAFELHNDWTRHQFQFKPPTNGLYLTVILESAGEAWIFVDDFSLICPKIDLGNDTTYCAIENLNLKTASKFDSYLWSNGSTDPQLTVQDPGLYWLEGKLGGCTVRDSIEFLEKPLLCSCKLYFPEIFSPNRDNINDTWAPLTPCELGTYELLIFNRWGGLVFQSKQATTAWNGQHGDQDQPSGVYVFRIRYRFASNDATLYQDEGLIQLLR